MSKSLVTLVAIACLATGASAQTTGASTARSGGLAGLLGGAMPSVGSVGAGNAAGLLGYCLKNNLLGSANALTGAGGATAAAGGSTGARSVLERLTGKPGVQTSPDYLAGQAGQVQTPSGQTLPLGGLGAQVKTKMCSMVLSRAKSFL